MINHETKRFRWGVMGLVVFILCAGGMILIQRNSKNQPQFGGKTLVDWIVHLNVSDPVQLSNHIKEFREAGRESFPLLLRLAQSDTPQVVKMVEPVMSRVPAWVPISFPNVTTYRVRRMQAIRLVAFIGPEARDAVPVLIKLVESNDPALGGYARMALSAVGTPAVPELCRLVRSSPDSVASAAAQALAEMPAEFSISAFPTLAEAAAGNRVGVAFQAIQALVKFGDRSVNALEQVGEHPDLFVQAAAMDAISRIDPSSPKLLPWSSNAISHQNVLVREAAQRVQNRIR